MPNMGQPIVDRLDDTHFFNISKYFIRTHPTQAEFKKTCFFISIGSSFRGRSRHSFLVGFL